LTKTVVTFQGASVYTERKEFEIEGVSNMRFNQFKSNYFKYPKVLCADVFCGTGTNDVRGEMIDGSPIRLLNGWSKANNQRVETTFWFSDVRQIACDVLERTIQDRFKIPIPVNAMAASDAINYLGEILLKDKNLFLLLILDPNGPKDFPKNETQDLLSSFSRRIDVIPYISATTINRCLGARNKAGYQLQGWLGQIENFDEGFVSSLISNGRQGWIRRPIDGDSQRWTMIPTFGCLKPRNGWDKQGYVEIDSHEGKEIVKYYCGGN